MAIVSYVCIVLISKTEGLSNTSKLSHDETTFVFRATPSIPPDYLIKLAEHHGGTLNGR